MRKRILGVILAVSMLLALTPNTVMAARMEGESLPIRETAEQTEKEGTADSASNMEGLGTEASPYQIKNAEQLRSFADMVNGVGGVPNTALCAVLTCGIDLSGICGADIGSWTPIGTDANPYTGIFDGGSFAITGLYYHKSNSSYAGLFGCNAGIIKNLGVVGADVAAGSYTGGVCGYNNGTITGCYNATPVKGARYTGGICGYNNDTGTVSICYNTGAVSGSKYVGGICGYNKNMASNCYNMGAVNGNSTSIGGICGYNRALVSNCFNTGTVKGGGKNYIGSVCGYNYSGSSFLNCYYLITGEEKGNYGVGMTQEQFASGEVCWLLNEGKSENVVWHQTCGAGFPAFGGKVVYQVKQRKTDGKSNEMIVAYANEKEKKQAAVNNTSAEETDSDNNSDNNSEGTTDGHIYQEPKWEWKEYNSAKAVFTCQDCGEKLVLKASISKKTTEATCAKEGETVYTASVDRDGETYKDKKTVKLEKTAHQQLKQISKAEATCTASGILQDCWTCPACGKYFADKAGMTELSREKVEIPAKGHQYSGPDWKWAADYTTASATFTCTACQQTEVREGKVTSETTATCTKPGETVYKAVVNFNSQNYEDEKSISGQPIPHSYGEPKWSWENDYSAARAVFTCARCDDTKTLTDNAIKKQQTDSTCIAEGKIEYTATVQLNDRDFSATKEEPLPKKDHLYGGPKWTWSSDFSKATATFSCANCQTAVSEEADVKTTETPGTDCKTPGKITYIATVTFNVDGKEYTDTQKKEIPAKHSPEPVAAEAPTCVKPGNEKYWKCSECSKLFADAKGSEEITNIPVIPAKGHTLKHVGNDRYECTECHNSFTVTELPDGTTRMYSVEEDAIIIPDETGNDNGVGYSDEEKQNGAEPINEESPSQSGSEEKQEDSESQNIDEQDTQNGQDGESLQNEQSEEDGQNEDKSNGDILDVPENAARYGLIYPEGEGTETNSITADAREGSAVNLRAESAGDGAAQTVLDQQQQGYPLWVSVAVLAALASVILFFILQRKDNR